MQVVPTQPTPPAPRSSTFQLLDKLAGGRLAERITELRDAGLSWEAIARQLHVEFEVTVTGETLRGWAKRSEPEAAAS